MCVVAKHLNGDGFIITAYITDKIKEGKVECAGNIISLIDLYIQRSFIISFANDKNSAAGYCTSAGVPR